MVDVAYSDGKATLLHGDVFDGLSFLRDCDVRFNVVVTSPPYYGLRVNKGTERWWDAGGDGEPWWGALGLEPVLDCSRLGGVRCSQCYTCHTLEWCDAVWEVLRDDGVFFLNLADSYIGSWGDSGHRPDRDGVPGVQRGKTTDWFKREDHPQFNPPTRAQKGMKPKDLAQMPNRVALALQQAGWWLRADCIWAKGISLNKKGLGELLRPYEGQYPAELQADLEAALYVGNNMPESTADRPTRSYEHILMLTKQERYASDMVAVRETGQRELEGKAGTFSRDTVNSGVSYVPGNGPQRRPDRDDRTPSGRNLRSVWVFPATGFGWHLCDSCHTVYSPAEYKRLPKVTVAADWRQKAAQESSPSNVEETVAHMGGGNTGFQDETKKGKLQLGVCAVCGEHERWSSHFSSFPETLPETAILMGSTPICCAGCGAPYRRVTRKSVGAHPGRWSKQPDALGDYNLDTGERHAAPGSLGGATTVETEGFDPNCTCNQELVGTSAPLVLDPFAGTGTTLLVASRLDRESFGIELSAGYVAIAAERLRRASGVKGKGGNDG